MSSPRPPHDEITPAAYRQAATIFLIVGLLFALAHLFIPTGPYRWLSILIALVCLARSVFYLLRSRA